MSAYSTEVDVLNRGLQHCRRDHIVAFTDQSEEANEGSFIYDKLRDAELRRNVWRFAIRRSVLRPITSTTVLWTPAAYVAATTYAIGNVVTYGGEWWASAAGSNTGNTPAPGAFWQHYIGVDSADTYDATISYFAGEIVIGSDVKVYLSLINNNLANDPTLDAGAHWLLQGGTTAYLQVLYPIGAGPISDLSTDNFFRLPRGYLRQAPADPKGGHNPFLGGPGGPISNDWVFENDYIVSSEAVELMLRYVADITDVTLMDPMFCEGLAARIGEDLAPVLAKPDVLQVILADTKRAYRDVMRDARLVNGIEEGPLDAEEDEYITVRY